jgi:hypothetical protein
MIKQSKLTLATLALLLSAFAAHAQLTPNYRRVVPPANAPKVLFVGDYITYNWASAFAANPNWINLGSATPNNFGPSLASFQSDVVNLHPAIVHIMVGAYAGYFVSDESALFDFQDFINTLDTYVRAAQAANTKVILGTTPPISASYVSNYYTQIVAAIAGYGAAHNIPVIDYADLLCGCASLSLGEFSIPLYSPTTNLLMVAAPNVVPGPDPNGVLPSTAGYAAMTQLAETAIATENLTLRSGWLQDVEIGNETLTGSPVNVNTVSPPATVQFTPIGYYSDGSQHPLINPNMQDATGTWTSSNPEVMNINQKGLTWALSNGTTIIRYTSPTGVSFNEWVMYVNAPRL